MTPQEDKRSRNNMQLLQGCAESTMLPVTQILRNPMSCQQAKPCWHRLVINSFSQLLSSNSSA
eukprot:12662238-Ditylum_brightwellii.AAC.2